MSGRLWIVSVFFWLLVSAHPAVCEGPTAPDVYISALTLGLKPLETSEEIRCTRFRNGSDDPQVHVGMKLAPGDILANPKGEVALEMTCPDGSVLRFSRAFRVMIQSPEDSDCAIDFRSGDLDVLTLHPTKVNVGGFTLGSEGTQFKVKLPIAASVSPQLVLYDSVIRLTIPRSGYTQILTTGTALEAMKGKLIETKIHSSRLRRSAKLYTRFDVARGLRADSGLDPETEANKLEEFHYDVLYRPAAVPPRVVLAKTQIQMGILNQAAFNLKRADVWNPQALAHLGIDPFVFDDFRQMSRATTTLCSRSECYAILIDGKSASSKGFSIKVSDSEMRGGWLGRHAGYFKMKYSEDLSWMTLYFTAGESPISPIRPLVGHSEDFSEYNYLVVEMKGEVGGECVLVGIRDTDDPDDRSETRKAVEVTAEWAEYWIDLKFFARRDPSESPLVLGKIYMPAELAFPCGARAGTQIVYVKNIKYFRQLPDSF
jgi:hypothetical protein